MSDAYFCGPNATNAKWNGVRPARSGPLQCDGSQSVWEAITGGPLPHLQIECDAIIGKQTHQKGWNWRYGSRVPIPLWQGILDIMLRKFTKGPLRALFYMMYRLSLVHISRGMILHFGKIIVRLICDVAHFWSCSSGIQFVCYWLFTK
jgi:hypothetical protein